jgi:hypothetical protein
MLVEATFGAVLLLMKTTASLAERNVKCNCHPFPLLPWIQGTFRE